MTRFYDYNTEEPIILHEMPDFLHDWKKTAHQSNGTACEPCHCFDVYGNVMLSAVSTTGTAIVAMARGSWTRVVAMV